jgi:hypothetical protein
MINHMTAQFVAGAIAGTWVITRKAAGSQTLAGANGLKDFKNDILYNARLRGTELR